MGYKFYSALQSREDLIQYGSNRLSIFTLQMFFNIDDISSIINDEIVDGPDDSGIDLIHIDIEKRVVVISQSYESKNLSKKTPQLTKLTGMLHGISKIITEPIDKLPLRLQSSARQLRIVLGKKQVDRFYLWYVHNLSGSINIKRELQTIESTVRSLTANYAIKDIICEEISGDRIEEIFQSLTASILVDEHFEIDVKDGYYERGGRWESFVTSISGKWLNDQFKKYQSKLFSSNVREYLGLNKSDKNINKNIQVTAQKNPVNFWVYNNGLTFLVNDFRVTEVKTKKTLAFDGLSILNGAQTTGAIGNIKTGLSKDIKVMVRIVKCNDDKTKTEIRLYNNSQNKIDAPDHRSNDNIQKRLVNDFKKYSDIQYKPRRGGIEDVIKRQQNTIPSALAGQLLASFHKEPEVAYHNKTKIWEDDNLYSRYFTQATAKHIILIFSLYEAIKSKKVFIVKSSKSRKLTEVEQTQLVFFQTRGSIFLFIAAISSCLEEIVDRPIPNGFRLCFKDGLCFDEMVKIWKPIADVACSFVGNLSKGFSDGAIRQDKAESAISEYKSFISAVKVVDKSIFDNFASYIDLG